MSKESLTYQDNRKLDYISRAPVIVTPVIVTVTTKSTECRNYLGSQDVLAV